MLSTALDALPVGMPVEDADREVIRVNERLYELFDVEGNPETAAGRDCEEFAAELSAVFADPEGFLGRIEAIVEAQRPVDGERLALSSGEALILTYRPIDLPGGDGHLWAYRRARSSERVD